MKTETGAWLASSKTETENRKQIWTQNKRSSALHVFPWFIFNVADNLASRQKCFNFSTNRVHSSGSKNDLFTLLFIWVKSKKRWSHNQRKIVRTGKKGALNKEQWCHPAVFGESRDREVSSLLSASHVAIPTTRTRGGGLYSAAFLKVDLVWKKVNLFYFWMEFGIKVWSFPILMISRCVGSISGRGLKSEGTKNNTFSNPLCLIHPR